MLAIIVILLLVLALIVVQASRPKHAESKKNDITSSEDAKGREIRDELTKSNPSFKRRRDLGRVAMNVALVDIKDIPVFEKTDKESEFITECLRGNFIFSQVTDMSEVVSAFEKHVVPDGEIVIKEGDDADYFYLIESGDIEFFIKDKPVGVRGEGEDFGDLALLRNCKRAATCVASGECVLWRLEQKTYRAVMAKNRSGRLTALVQMLKKIPALSTYLNDHLLEKIAATLVEKKFAKDDILMKKGDIGSEMLIIKSGKVLLRDIEAKGRKYDDVELKTGDFFGERSVLESEPRAATAVAIEDSVMFCLSKESFVKHIGSMDQLKRDATYLRLLKSIKIFADSDISPPEYEEIISRIKNVSVEKGTVIYTENDNNKNIYLIESGEVTVSSESKSERSEKMHFGDDHFLHSYKKAPETVTAKVDTAMGVLSVDSLVTVIRAIARLNSKDPKARWRRAILKVQAMNRIGRMVGGSAGKDFDTIRTASKVPTELSALHRHRILGIGAFGKVWLVSPKNDSGDANKNKVYALKVQKKRQLLDNKMSTAVIREASIMKSLDHPFVMSLHNVYQDGTSVYFLTNFIRGGELFRVLNEDGVGVAIPNDDARFYAAGVFEGLNHMHTRGILYRDLKPENVLIGEDGYPVLVDLGFAKKLVEGKAFTMCGSPYYIAPEVLLGTGHDKSFDHWAWAIMVHEMLSGDVPFKDSAKASQIKLFKAIAKGRFKISDILNESAIDLVKKILVTDVAERLGSLAGGVRDIKSHDWFEGIDFDAVGNKSVTPPWVPDVGHALDCSEFEDFSHEEFEEEPNHLDVLTDAENALFNDLDEIMNGRFEVSL